MWPCPEIEKGWIQYCSSMITEAAVIQLPKHAQTFRLFLLCTALVIMCFIVSTGLQLWHDHAISTTIPHNSHTIPLPLSSTETHQIDFALQLKMQTSSHSFDSLAAIVLFDRMHKSIRILMWSIHSWPRCGLGTELGIWHRVGLELALGDSDSDLAALITLVEDKKTQIKNTK